MDIRRSFDAETSYDRSHRLFTVEIKIGHIDHPCVTEMEFVDLWSLKGEKRAPNFHSTSLSLPFFN